MKSEIQEQHSEQIIPKIPSKIAQEQALFHIAFTERRKINLQKLKLYVTARDISHKERIRIYLVLQNLFGQKIQYTKNFIKDFIKYFEDTLGLYASFYKSIAKLDLHKKPKEQFIYEAFEKVVLELTQLNNGEVQNLKVLTVWIQKILLPALKAIYDMYRDWTKQQKKQLQSFEGDIQSAKKVQYKFYEKLNDNNDLLENEIILVDKYEATDELMIKWGNKIFKSWDNLLKKQGQIREQLQKNMIEFHDKFIRVYTETQASKSLLKYWMDLQSVPTWYKTFTSVLSDKDAEFISYGCKSNNIKTNFQPFMNLLYEKDRIGDPIKLIEILQNKRFKCKLQKSQREYLNIRLYFTIDSNILLFDEAKKKVIMKLKQSSFKIRRLSENLIQIVGIQIGMIMDSKRRENVHFNTMDQAEQFVFFVENLLKQISEGVK